MSITVTVKLTPDTARQLLAVSERELAKLKDAYDAKFAEVAELRKAVQAANFNQEKATSGETGQPLRVSKNPESGRAPKGESLGVIRAFLQSHKGSGWSAGEISEKTGTSFSTTIRVLKQLNDEGELDRIGDKWGVGA